MLAALLATRTENESLARRLAHVPVDGAPLERETVVHWDDNQIPFIEASTDRDLAVALGVVHAHLRLGQMEFFRRLSQGRLAEMAGPFVAHIDHALRILNVGRAAPEIEAGLPPETRDWLDGFVAGINHYLMNVRRLPPEFALLGMKREPWTVREVITLGRLAAADVNWLVWFPLLKLRDRPDWPELWRRLVESGRASLPSFRRRRRRLAFLTRLLGGFGRHGSNAFAVAGKRSVSGAALMANDPHLEITLPNLWVIVGMKSPSYHTVGLMLPGLPFVGVGRNPHIAWGGTNMRAASSDLYDVSSLTPAAVRTRQETIRVRWGRDRRITVRETELGPVLSDAPALKSTRTPPFALRWVGHQASDEFTAMLRMNRARNWQEFRDAFEDFAVAGLNMLYADEDGNIGQVLAVRLPVRSGGTPPDLVLDPRDESTRWNGLVGSTDLPTSFNPPSGFLVSANNRPVDANVPISFFFASDDRVERISTLVERTDKVSLADACRIQRDVYMSSSAALRDVLMQKIEDLGLDERTVAAERELISLVRAWNGHYRAASRGALAFELLLHQFSLGFYGRRFARNAGTGYSGVIRIKLFLMEDVERSTVKALAPHLDRAIVRAARRLRKFGTWGDMHRLVLAHPLSQVPLLGRRFRFADHPVGGSTDTVMKTAHRLTDKRHAVDYGANARHVSDLSDPDRNYFVLLGGQDGWMGSTTFLNQFPLWLEGAYVQVPLRLETVRATFRHRSVLTPARADA